ncbi:MAG: type I glyceraldehyde-3-phosphate dehydrogenase [Bdellovibrionales bacterium]|nr:type I glyceraldehyde-3-phosphate dehydrogenase [Bdellovibrionales bacterium]
MEKIKVGINGFGRIGRLIFRAGFEHLDIVGINSLDDPKGMAHLLKYDSTHGRYSKDVCVEDSILRVDGKSISLSATKNPLEIPWKKWGVDLVLECTGAFKSKEDFLKHINAGAKRVLVSAPADGVDLTVVYGINHTQYDLEKHLVVSNASCTTNCLAPLAKVLDEAFTIEQGLMTTIHSYTNDQNVLDATHKDLRRSRAAGLSMIPTTTGAAKAVGLVLPHLKGKVDGVSIRVPTPNVSLVDLVFRAQKSLSVESINRTLQEAAQGSLKGILFCEKDPLVSVDYNGSTYSSIVDLANTMVMGEKLAKVFSWYDNEMGFSSRMVDMALYMAKKG